MTSVVRFDLFDQRLTDETEAVHLHQRVTGKSPQTGVLSFFQAVKSLFQPCLADLIWNIVGKILFVRSRHGTVRADIADKVCRGRFLRINTPFGLIEFHAAEITGGFQSPGCLLRGQIIENDQRQSRPPQVTAYRLTGQRRRAAYRMGDTGRHIDDMVDGFAPSAADTHFFGIKEQLHLSGISGQQFFIGRIDIPPFRRDADTADGLTRNAFTVFFPVTDLFAVKADQQQQKSRKKEKAENDQPPFLTELIQIECIVFFHCCPPLVTSRELTRR